MRIADLEKKYPWTNHSLVRLFAECFSESEWDAIHTAGLENFIQKNLISDEALGFFFSTIYQIKMQRGNELQSTLQELNQASVKDNNGFKEMLAEMKLKQDDTLFAYVVATQMKQLTTSEKLKNMVPKIKTLLATGFSKEILDGFLSVSINPRELIQSSSAKVGVDIVGVFSLVTSAIHLLTTSEESMDYLDKKNKLKELFNLEVIPFMLKEYSHLDLSPGKLRLFTQNTLTYEFFCGLCTSGTSCFFKPNPSIEEYNGFVHMFTQIGNFYDHLSQQLDAKHQTLGYSV